MKFYQRFGGRKAFLSLLLFAVTLTIYLVDGLVKSASFDIQFTEVTDFWKWVAGLFILGNVGAKAANAVQRAQERAIKQTQRKSKNGS